MKSNNISYPHPVMGHMDDYNNICEIINDELIERDDEYEFKCSLNHNNNQIKENINEGYFSYVCEISNNLTFLRKGIKQASPDFTITLNRLKLRGPVTFHFYIVCNESFRGYTNIDFHEDYKGFTFDLKSGYIIADFGGKQFDADIQYQKINGVSAFMTIIDGGKDLSMPKYLLDDDFIKIELPNELYCIFKNRSISQSKIYAPIIHSSIVFNALLYALQNYDSHQEKAWAKTLEYRINHDSDLKNYQLDDSDSYFDIAQLILKNPYERLFKSLNALNSQTDE